MKRKQYNLTPLPYATAPLAIYQFTQLSASFAGWLFNGGAINDFTDSYNLEDKSSNHFSYYPGGYPRPPVNSYTTHYSTSSNEPSVGIDVFVFIYSTALITGLVFQTYQWFSQHYFDHELKGYTATPNLLIQFSGLFILYNFIMTCYQFTNQNEYQYSSHINPFTLTKLLFVSAGIEKTGQLISPHMKKVNTLLQIRAKIKYENNTLNIDQPNQQYQRFMSLLNKPEILTWLTPLFDKRTLKIDFNGQSQIGDIVFGKSEMTINNASALYGNLVEKAPSQIKPLLEDLNPLIPAYIKTSLQGDGVTLSEKYQPYKELSQYLVQKLNDDPNTFYKYLSCSIPFIKNPETFSKETIEAINHSVDGISDDSTERIWNIGSKLYYTYIIGIPIIYAIYLVMGLFIALSGYLLVQNIILLTVLSPVMSLLLMTLIYTLIEITIIIFHIYNRYCGISECLNRWDEEGNINDNPESLKHLNPNRFTELLNQINSAGDASGLYRAIWFLCVMLASVVVSIATSSVIATYTAIPLITQVLAISAFSVIPIIIGISSFIIYKNLPQNKIWLIPITNMIYTSVGIILIQYMIIATLPGLILTAVATATIGLISFASIALQKTDEDLNQLRLDEVTLKSDRTPTKREELSIVPLSKNDSLSSESDSTPPENDSTSSPDMTGKPN
ncbi:MAG: hypothetical protein ACON5A_00860 [Candidatus Comchoanobacterales bacterium]